MKLTLGFSPCPNDTFLFDALVHGRVRDPELEFEIILDDVEALNHQALRGKLDVTKLSYATLPLVWEEYGLLRSGSALGRGCGPLLVAASPRPAGDAPDWTVAIPGENTTANFLLRFAYPEIRIKHAMVFHEIEDAVLRGEVDAGLLIHENRFTYAAKGLHCLSDLGAVWEERKNLPIPLGGIVMRRALGPVLARRVESLIRQSVEYAFQHPDASRAYVQEHAQEMAPSVQQAHIELYVNRFTADLGADGEAAVRALLQQAGEKRNDLFAAPENV